MCRKIQGVRWNDIRERSLTSDYYDYLQFYRKNRELSAETKDRIEGALARAKNNFREIFVKDYQNWIKYEAKGGFRLNRYVRRSCLPIVRFPRHIVQTLKTNPMFADAIGKLETNNARNYKRLQGLYEKYKREGGTITPELRENLNFIRCRKIAENEKSYDSRKPVVVRLLLVFRSSSHSHHFAFFRIKADKEVGHMIQKVFNRYEKKYLLDQKTYEVFKRNWMSIWQRILPIFLRSRKNITDWSIKDGSPYLGKKPKVSGRRRCAKRNRSIYREVDYFFTHYGIRPKRYIAYDRLAPGYYLMEVKISDAMPKWFVDLLSKYGIYNTSFSKYGMDQWRDLHCDCGRHRRPDLYGRFYGDLCRRKRWYHGRRTYGRTGYERRYGWRTTG